MKFEIQGVEELNKRLAALHDDVGRKALKQVAQAVYKQALKGADKHTKTGIMLKSGYLRPEGEGYRIGFDAPYSPFVHWGTKAHVIESKPYPYPVFFMRRTKSGKTVPYLKRTKSLRLAHGNNWIFAEKVFHPGYKGDPWLQDAADYAIRNFDSIIKKAMK